MGDAGHPAHPRRLAGAEPIEVGADVAHHPKLVELRVVEQRYQAVPAVLDGATVVEVASRFEVGRQTVHRWLRRYQGGGPPARADRSHRPARSPQQIPADVEAQILKWRRRQPGLGSTAAGP